MKGDFTRFTFDPGKHYDSVLMQQGRVQTDADWNEQVLIAEHRSRIKLLDIIGQTGTPQDFKASGLGSFLVHYSPDSADKHKLFINHGHYYVHGILVESEEPVRYDTQPGARLPHSGGAGTYVVYLDVWKRHITALEDPGIREVALAGADSGTRSKVVWQVRMERKGDLSVDLASVDTRTYGADWRPTGTESTGAMDVKAGNLPPENQLYRVEIHRGGTHGTASFKWSRDNGTVVARVLSHSSLVEHQVERDGAEVSVWQFSIRIDQPGRDSFGSFLPGQMVELSSDQLILQRKPGIFCRLVKVVGDTLHLEVLKNSVPLSSTDGPDINPLAGTTRTVRRWDNTWNPDASGITLQTVGGDYTQNGRHLLEHDITVKFAAEIQAGTSCVYQTGDYWLIPARKVSGLEGWVESEQQPPTGERHYHAPLALLKLQADGSIADTVNDVRDIRDVFPTLRSALSGAGSLVQGTGIQNRLPRWQSTGGAMLVNSGITDDGSSVTIDSSLKVSTASSSVTIKRFTGASIPLETEPDAVVPTTAAVTSYVEGVVSGKTGQLAKFTGSHLLGDSIVSESGTTLTVNGSLKVSTTGDSITKFSNTALETAGSQVVPTSQAVANYVKARGFGSGTLNKLVKWNGTDTAGDSRITDDGATANPVKVDAKAEVTGTLKVGTDTSAVTISRFTSSAIKSMTTELGTTVPTSQAVKDFVGDFVNQTVPAGTVVAYASETVPDGWLECDGRSLDGAATATGYPNLFKAIGKVFGHGNGSTTGFNLPDLRGRFVRGWNHRDGVGGADPNAAERVASATGGAVKDHVGSYQDDQYFKHSHGFTVGSGSIGSADVSHGHAHGVVSSVESLSEVTDDHGSGKYIYTVAGLTTERRTFQFHTSSATDWTTIQHSHALTLSGGSVGEAGGSETRPKNIYLMYIIKY
jgi:microcystin-dependent protein